MKTLLKNIECAVVMLPGIAAGWCLLAAIEFTVAGQLPIAKLDITVFGVLALVQLVALRHWKPPK